MGLDLRAAVVRSRRVRIRVAAMTPTPRTPWRELRMRTQPRRGLMLREAALYLGIDARAFGRAVARLDAPQPRMVLGVPRWDVADLDRWLEEQPRRGEAQGPRSRAVPPRI